MKLSALAVLLLCSLLVQRASTQDAITKTINEIANINPASLYNMGAQPFSQVNFQTLAKAVGSIYTTLQILTLPNIRNQFSSLQGSVQTLSSLINTLNSTLNRVNQTLTSEIDYNSAQDTLMFQSLNRSLSQINTTVNSISGSNCYANLTLLTSRFNAFVTQDAADKLTLRTGISSLNITIQANNLTTVAALASLRANITLLDSKITALAAQASRNNTLTSARVDVLNTTFTQKFITEQIPEDQLFAYYNQTLANLTNAVNGINGTPIDLSDMQAAVDNISQYLIDEQAEEDVIFAALNQSVGNLTSNLGNLASNVSNLNGSVANLSSNLSNLSRVFDQEEATEEILFGAYNDSLGNLTANLNNLSGVVDESVANLSTVVDAAAANLTNLSNSFDLFAFSSSNNITNLSNISDSLSHQISADRAVLLDYIDNAILSNISAINITASLTASDLAGIISDVQSLIAGNATALNQLILSNFTQLNDTINTNQIDLKARIDSLYTNLSYQIRRNNDTLNQKIDTNLTQLQTYVNDSLSIIQSDIQNLYANDTITVYSENPSNFNAYVVFKKTITEDGSGIASLNEDRFDYYADYQNIVFANTPTVTSSLEYIGSDIDTAKKVSLTVEQVSSYLFLVRFSTLDGTALVHNEWKANIIAYGN